ncbi:hypothetical protein HN011_008617 [Eciton burchellii]|nr:hypothetical protein HN011_008617 [Eciton burchellii]
MASENNCQKTWLEKTMANIIKTLGVSDARYELEDSTDIYASSMYYVTLKYKSRSDKNKELAIMLKRPRQTEIVREIFQLDYQFHNEILFYGSYAEPADNFARCFYLNETLPTDTVIALENVCKFGYRICSHAYDPPLEYTLAAVRELACFHGKGYVMKEQQPQKFFEIVGQLCKFRYDEKSMFKPYVDIMVPRAAKYLRRQGYDPIFCDKIDILFKDVFSNVLMKLVQPLEPLSTICHGDFTMNNILFKPEVSGKYRAMIIDLAMIVHATPVIDLSTYLCLHCSNETVKNRFSEIMWAYHDALREYLQDAGIWDVNKYSYHALLENYVQGAFFGFLIASFYLTSVMGCNDMEPKELAKKNPIEYANICMQAGGDEVSKILANMLLYMRDIGCLKHLL